MEFIIFLFFLTIAAVVGYFVFRYFVVRYWLTSPGKKKQREIRSKLHTYYDIPWFMRIKLKLQEGQTWDVTNSNKMYPRNTYIGEAKIDGVVFDFVADTGYMSVPTLSYDGNQIDPKKFKQQYAAIKTNK